MPTSDAAFTLDDLSLVSSAVQVILPNQLTMESGEPLITEDGYIITLENWSVSQLGISLDPLTLVSTSHVSGGSNAVFTLDPLTLVSTAHVAGTPVIPPVIPPVEPIPPGPGVPVYQSPAPLKPCVVAVTCYPCFDEPIANLSAEQPDAPTWLQDFVYYNPPPINNLFQRLGCLGWAYSTVSQAEADHLAVLNAEECVNTGYSVPTGGGFTTRPYYSSQPQTCRGQCPDGSFFTVTIPAGAVLSPWSQDDADTRAKSICTVRLQGISFCAGDLPGGCVGIGYYEAITMSGGVAPLTFQLINGTTPPPGLTLTDDGVMFGNPTTAGYYSFDVLVTDSTTPYPTVLQKTFLMSVMEITTPASLPSGHINSAYSETLAQTGGLPPYTWKVIGGSLPPGIGLDPATGVLSGSCSIKGDYTFSVELDDSSGARCEKTFTVSFFIVGCRIIESYTIGSGITYVDEIFETPTGHCTSIPPAVALAYAQFHGDTFSPGVQLPTGGSFRVTTKASPCPCDPNWRYEVSTNCNSSSLNFNYQLYRNNVLVADTVSYFESVHPAVVDEEITWELFWDYPDPLVGIYNWSVQLLFKPISPGCP